MEWIGEAWPYMGPVVSVALSWGMVRADQTNQGRRLDAVESEVRDLHAGGVAVVRVDTAVMDIARRLDRIERLLDRRSIHAVS